MLSIEQIAFAMPMISKADTSSSAYSKDEVDFPTIASSDDISAKLVHDDTLVDNGDGTFTFTSKITADYSFSDISMSRLKSTDGEYPLDKAGKYLIELWGGDGGDGSEFFPMSFKAGKGGAGGFVYGMLDVSTTDAGTKKLVYEIGSKGESETRSVTGGGTAGIGGGAGDVAIFSVGAGGGYSAVYLVDNSVTIGQDVPNVSNLRDDPSKVLMIAGGGGGGGAGASLHSLNFLSTIFGGEGKANGGDGGYFESEINATPSIGKFDKTNTDNAAFSNYIGKYYAGENGSTSGTKSAYVGQGGTDRPGEIVKSFIGFIEASSYPNDWQRIFHPDAKRGIGGRGNFRGGGGGAGFAGGSGGLQNEPLEARNIGGGGGGSSYVAAGASDGGIAGFTPFANISTEQQSYFVDKDKNTNAATGGAVVIRYLPANADYSYLENVTIEGTISDYFDVTGTYVNSKANGTTSGTITADANNKISVSGSIAPKADGLEKGQANDALTISLKLKPKDGFAGGNDVPIFTVDENNMAFTCTEVTDSVDKKSCKFLDIKNVKNPDEKDVSHVNVKLNVDYSTNSLVKGIGDNYTADQLKNTPVSYDANNKMHDFITGINYEVLDKDNATFSSYTVQSSDKDTIKTYTVKATITPNSNQAAKVGDAGSGVITKTAKVKCVEESPLYVDGFYVNAKKKLTYNETDKTYDFDVDLTANLDNDETFEAYPPVTTSTLDITRPYGTATYTTTVTLPAGIYYIEAWGGDGGNGGNKTPQSGLFADALSGSGGKGGKGGFINGYIKVNENETKTLSISLGAKGPNGTNADKIDNVTNGQGGHETSVTIVGELSPALIAGGGGGGGKPLRSTHLGGATDQNYHMGYTGLDGEGVSYERIKETQDNKDPVSDITLPYSYNTTYQGQNAINVTNSNFPNKHSEHLSGATLVSQENFDRIISNFAKGGKSESELPSSLDELQIQNNSELISFINGSTTITKGTGITYVGDLTADLTIGTALNVEAFYVDYPGYFNNGSNDYGTNWKSQPFTLKAIYNNTTKSASEITNQNGKGTVRITRLGVKGDINGVKYDSVSDYDTALNTAKSTALDNAAANISTKAFSITEKFSQYFDYVGCADLADKCNTVVTGTTNQNQREFILTVNTSVAKEKVTSYTSTETSTQPISGYGYYVDKTSYTYSLNNVKMGARVKLKPKEGFLGGNDVPLLDETENNKYNAQTDKDKAAVTITHHDTTTESDDVAGIPPDLMTDYANVEIPELDQWINGTEPLPSEVIVPYGGKLSDVINPTITDPTSGKTWEKEFVQWNETRSPGVNDPVTSEGYLTLTGSLDPRDTDPDAVVIPKVDGKSVAEKVKIRLKYTLTQTLTGFESSIADNTYEFTKDDIDGDNLVVELTLKDGYDPEQSYSVTVTMGDTTIPASAMDNGKITVTIPKSSINNNISIVTTATALQHKVKFMYQVYDGISISTQESDGPTYSNGAEIDASDPGFYPFNPTSAEYPYGYDAYDWDWPIEPNAGTTSKYTMGESDIYVVGTYRPEVYKLVVDYKAKNDEDKADFESKLPEKDRHYVSPDRTEYDEVNNLFRIALTKGTDYFVRSPEVQGYFPNHPLISGTVDDNAINNYLTEDITVNGKTYKGHTETVTYEKIGTGTNLIINFIECDAHGNPIRNGTAEQIAIDAGAYDENTAAIKNKIDRYMASNTYEIYKRTKMMANSIEEVVDAIEGTADDGVVETYYVYYIPKRVQVTVNFNAVDSNADPINKPVAANVNISDSDLSRTVIKGREYGYDYVSDSYIGLPRAVCTGFVFEGWYTSDGKRIEDDTIVEGTGTIELYAHWKSAYVTITINYNYANNVSDTDKRGETAAPSWVSGENGIPPLEYGMSYNVTSPKYNEATPNVNSNLNGYTPDKEVVKGVALQPETVPVFYTDTNNSSGTVKLRVDVYSSAYNGGNDQPTSIHKISRGTFILLDQNGNEIANSRIENNNGTLEWTDVETKIAAGGIYTIKCVDPPTGYGVTEKPVTLDQETTQGSREYHFNFFLEESPFKLPMAGSKPMTGYTVFGISAMLLAGLLMFAYVNSRTEENNEKE